jgi:hypothetical protein
MDGSSRSKAEKANIVTKRRIEIKPPSLSSSHEITLLAGGDIMLSHPLKPNHLQNVFNTNMTIRQFSPHASQFSESIYVLLECNLLWVLMKWFSG